MHFNDESFSAATNIAVSATHTLTSNGLYYDVGLTESEGDWKCLYQEEDPTYTSSRSQLITTMSNQPDHHGSSGKWLDGKEIAKHNSKTSCWVIVDKKCYDTTDFLEEHPGGAAIILKYAGKDATEAFGETLQPFH